MKKLQNKAIRNIAKASYLDHNLFVHYKCLKILIILKLKALKLKAKNNMLPINLLFFFITTEEMH